MESRSRTNAAEPSTAALREKAGELREDLRDMATLAAGAGREQVQKVRDAATDKYDEAKGRVINWEQLLETYVRERPLKSLVIAAVVGMLFANFWRRS